MAVTLYESTKPFAKAGRVSATYPDALTVREALQSPAASLTQALDLHRATVAADRFGFPLAYTGRFAVVFRLTLPGNVAVALRFFTSPDNSLSRDRDDRSVATASALSELQAQIGDLLPPFLHVPEAVRIGKVSYTAQVLPWAEGEPLLRFVSRHTHHPDILRTLAQTMHEAVERLETAGVTHGDLQHDNILVRDNGRQITFVDYDAVHTPQLSAFAPPLEAGHANYQHPDRTAAHYGIVGGDLFASAVIRTGLLLVAANPAAWETFAGDTGEGILFTAADFAYPSVSPVFQAAYEAATQNPVLAQAVAELETLCREPLSQTKRPETYPIPRAKHQVPVPALPSRVTPTCAEEEPRPMSYLAPLHSPALARQEAAHLLVLRGFLTLAPAMTWLVLLWAWNAASEKWSFLACLFVLLTVIVAAFLYLTWGVKKQYDALELEAAKLREAERLDRDREKRLRRRAKRRDVPPEAWQERAHLRQTLAQVPLSRAIGDTGVSASTVRGLHEQGICTAAHLWIRHGFMPTGTDAADAALLRVWLSDLESREKQRFARDNNPAQAAQDTLVRIAEARAKRAARLAELACERNAFPDATLTEFLRRGIGLRTVRAAGAT